MKQFQPVTPVDRLRALSQVAAHDPGSWLSDFHTALESLGYEFVAEAPCECAFYKHGHDAACGFVKVVESNTDADNVLDKQQSP